jgi:hypothetical protein
MQRCENCPKEFEPTKPVRAEQRFCSPECRKAWHYRDRKDAAYRAKVEKAEDRMNGHGEGKRIDLAALGLAGPKPTIRQIRSLRG